MNVEALKQTNVTRTPCVPTQKDPTSAVVLETLRETVKSAQVKYCLLLLLLLLLLGFLHSM